MTNTITILPDETTFDTVAADRIVAQIKSKVDSVIGLSTGRTTGNMHRLVADRWKQERFDVSRLTLFGLDEVTGVDREYAGACYKMLRTEIADGMNLGEEQLLMLPTRSDDFDRDCHAFCQMLDEKGGADLLILGLGENGHLGFNQPGSDFASGCRTTRMHAELEVRIRRETATPDDVPLGGITLGVKDIMHMRRIILVAKGKNKAEAVKQMLHGPVTPDFPASILQLHNNCEFLLDAEAASLILR